MCLRNGANIDTYPDGSVYWPICALKNITDGRTCKDECRRHSRMLTHDRQGMCLKEQHRPANTSEALGYVRLYVHCPAIIEVHQNNHRSRPRA